MRPLLRLVLILMLVMCSPRLAWAHGMRSIYVEITELSPGTAQVTWRTQVPVTGVRISVDAPCTLENGKPEGGGASRLDCPHTLDGAKIRVEGLGPIIGEAVVWLVRADGTAESHLLTGTALSFTIVGTTTGWSVASQYVRLGVRHIFTGPDHLLFLAALVLCLRRVRAVLLAETAFTVSHSISYSAAALGFVRVSAPAAEACIALSLVLVALDINVSALTTTGERGLCSLDRDREARRGAVLAFVFGLVHGLGFAGGLTEIGLPARAVPAALAGFACGVEVGQVLFLTAVFLIFLFAQRLRVDRPLRSLGAYTVGAAGSFWLFERIRTLLPLLA